MYVCFSILPLDLDFVLVHSDTRLVSYISIALCLKATPLISIAPSGLSYEMSYKNNSGDTSLVSKDDNPRQAQENNWWSQRDLNPCLSLERDGLKK